MALGSTTKSLTEVSSSTLLCYLLNLVQKIHSACCKLVRTYSNAIDKTINKHFINIINTVFFQYEESLEEVDDDSVSDKFSCPQCSSTFSFKQGLNRHWKRIHGNSLHTLVAPTCNKEGKVSQQDKLPRVQCPFQECNVVVTTVPHLTSHCSSEHDTDLGNNSGNKNA